MVVVTFAVLPKVSTSQAAVFAVVEVALANVALAVHLGAADPAPINTRFAVPAPVLTNLVAGLAYITP